MTGTGTHAKAKSVPARTGRAVALLGWAITYLDEPSDTRDAFMLYEQRSASGGVIPPHREDNHEAFVHDGTIIRSGDVDALLAAQHVSANSESRVAEGHDTV